MKNRLKENIMLIVLSVIIVCCTLSINYKLDTIENEINNKVGFISVKVESIGWILADMVEKVNNIQNSL